MSISLILDSSSITNYQSNDFTIRFASPIVLNKDPNNVAPYEVALISANLWYSWFNISAAQDNNTIRWSNDSGETWNTVVFPDGSYQLSDLNSYLQGSISANGGTGTSISITPNYSTLQCVVTLAADYQLDLSVSKMNVILGFASAIVTVSSTAGNIANITNSVNSIIINCSLVQDTFINTSKTSAIYQFVATVPPGSNIGLAPYNPVYLPLANNVSIAEIRLFMTDQLQRPLNLNGQPVTVLLNIRQCQITQLK